MSTFTLRSSSYGSTILHTAEKKHSIRHVWTGSSRKRTRYENQRHGRRKSRLFCPHRSLRGFGPSTRRAEIQKKTKNNTELFAFQKVWQAAGRPLLAAPRKRQQPVTRVSTTRNLGLQKRASSSSYTTLWRQNTWQRSPKRKIYDSLNTRGFHHHPHHRPTSFLA